MGSFFKGLLEELKDDIKSDLRSEIRSETKNLTHDTIDGVKDMLHPKKKEIVNGNTTIQPAVQQPVQQQMVQPVQQQMVQPVQQQIVQPMQQQMVQPMQQQMVQPVQPVVQQPVQSAPIELSRDDKVFGKSIDEYREIFQRLTKKHGEDIAGIYADPEYQRLDAETKEYINRVYMPTIEQTAKAAAEFENEYQTQMGARVDGVQAMLDNAKSDGELTVEEQNAVDKEAMKVVGEAIETMGNMAPKYLEKAGDIAQDLSGRIENKQLAGAIGDLGNTLKSDETQQVTKNSAIEYSKSFGQLANMGETMAQAPEAVATTVQYGQEKMQEMNDNLHVAVEAVGMSQNDIDDAYNKGAEMSIEQATNNAMAEMGKLGQLTQTGGTEEEIKDATRKTLEASLSSFGALFKGDE